MQMGLSEGVWTDVIATVIVITSNVIVIDYICAVIAPCLGLGASNSRAAPDSPHSSYATAATLGFVHACRSVKLLTDARSDFAAV